MSGPVQHAVLPGEEVEEVVLGGGASSATASASEGSPSTLGDASPLDSHPSFGDEGVQDRAELLRGPVPEAAPLEGVIVLPTPQAQVAVPAEGQFLFGDEVSWQVLLAQILKFQIFILSVITFHIMYLILWRLYNAIYIFFQSSSFFS